MTDSSRANIALQITHQLNEVSLRNQWRDDDKFSIRLARQLAAGSLPTNQAQFLKQVQHIKTHFFRQNRISKDKYSKHVWPYLSQVTQNMESYEKTHNSSTSTIASENALFQVVVEVLTSYKEEIETTRLWQPFWNEEKRKPHIPKEEPSLQPIIFSQLRPRFRQRGIEFLREPNDGAGPLDFRCTTTYGNTVLNCGIEFKRAQHRQLEHKLQTQLTAYMDAIGTRHGIFFVFWFKDDSIYQKPKKYASAQALHESLLNATKSVASRVIEVIVVDVTPKPSASRR